MAKPRTQKLKVFRTPIGFHDAIVAAPSQKAALQAWGADSNLFAQGVAEMVDEPALVEAAMAQPGEVVRVLRGSKEEQVAALGRGVKRVKTAGPPPAPPASGRGVKKAKPPRPPKPSRAAIEALEEEKAAAEKEQARKLEAIDSKIAALERKRRDAEREFSRARRDIENRLEEEQARYNRDFRAWKER